MIGTSARMLIDEIEKRTNSTRADCMSFIWLKTECREYKNNGLGGGNFVCAQGLLANLNFLSAIHYFLSADASWIAKLKQEKEVCRNILQELKKQRKELSHAICPKNLVNETEAFCCLVKALPFDIGLQSLKDEEIKQIWAKLRHKLAHLDWPAMAVSSIDSNSYSSFEDALMALQISTKFSFEDGRCNVERLSRDVKRISVWLCEEIKTNTFSGDNVGLALNYIRENY